MKNKIKTAIGWFRASLLPQFIFLAVVTAMLFVVAAQIVTQDYFDTSLRRAIDAVQSDTTLMQAQNIERQLHTYINSVYELVIDRGLLNTARSLNQSDLSRRASLTLDLRQRLEKYAANGIVGVTVVLPDRQIIFYNRLYGNWLGLPWFAGGLLVSGSNDALYALYDKTLESGSITAGFNPVWHQTTGTFLMHLAHPLLDLYTRARHGMVVLSFDTRTLRAMVNPARKKGEENPISYNILTNAQGQIVAHQDETLIGKTLCLDKTRKKEADPQLVCLSDDMIVKEEPVGRLGMLLYSVTDRRITKRQAQAYTFSMVVTISLIVLIYLAIFIFMMRRMMSSVKALHNGLETVQGGALDVYVKPVGRHEVARSIRAFNAMSKRLKQSEENQRIQAEKTIAALKRERVAEIKTLENQINSHFLYNTLNSISYSAIRSGNLDVSKQIKHLSHVLRYTFEKSDGVVRAAKEAQWLDEYLSLQKLRFGNAFDYTVRVDKAVEGWPMRKLIVQPFVENSVLHGFEGRTFGCMLTVTFAPYAGDRMRVTIRDNGCGIPPERLLALQNYLHDPHGEGTEGIGLENAFLRIRSYYSEKARIILRSWVGIGTTVVLLLPRYDKEN